MIAAIRPDIVVRIQAGLNRTKLREKTLGFYFIYHLATILKLILKIYLTTLKIYLFSKNSNDIIFSRENI